MSMINKISTPHPEVTIKNRTKEEKFSDAEQFESQFLEMVEKVENMGSEIDGLMEDASQQNPVSVQNGVHRVGSYIKSMAGIVEDFSRPTSQGNPAKQAGSPANSQNHSE